MNIQLLMSTWQTCDSLVTVIATTLYVAEIEMSRNTNPNTIINILIPSTLWFFFKEIHLIQVPRTEHSGEQEMAHTYVLYGSARKLPKLFLNVQYEAAAICPFFILLYPSKWWSMHTRRQKYTGKKLIQLNSIITRENMRRDPSTKPRTYLKAPCVIFR